MQIDFDTIRDEFSIADYISDHVMAAFADDWSSEADVPWDEIEDSFVGDYLGSSEDEAIGDYLFDMNASCSLLWGEHIGPLARYIDWEAYGRDERLSGYFRAVRLDIYGGTWYIFRNL
jgi:antirestriction protein